MFKRTFDMVAAIIGLVLLSPVILIIAIAVAVDSGFPVFYRAERAGRQGRSFWILKFRSMRSAAPNEGSHHSGDDDPRITRVGRVMRRFKLDELPQLVNVLIGHMSLVGPRPETLEYIKLYTDAEMIILSVRPGITDYASIEFADLGSILAGGDPDEIYFEKVWKPKMELRIKYVNEHSFFGDMRLIFLTFKAAVVPSRNKTG
jgi:lipopolysaccharide/colanic/teichoic acid biosynthesis glycosyltransferase